MCGDCHTAFSPAKPKPCKYSLAHQLWLGRWDPLFRGANLSHQMLLALPRVVTTKVDLRPEGKAKSKSGDTAAWDFLLDQSGISALSFCSAMALARKPWLVSRLAL